MTKMSRVWTLSKAIMIDEKRIERYMYFVKSEETRRKDRLRENKIEWGKFLFLLWSYYLKRMTKIQRDGEKKEKLFRVF